MAKIITKKRFWLIIFLALIGTGLFIYFISRKAARPGEARSAEAPPEIVGDKVSPISVIASPEEGSAHHRDFLAKIWDVDMGGSKLDASRCGYSVYNCSRVKCAVIAANEARSCNSSISISVGEGGFCRSEGIKSCRLVVWSEDGAGNRSAASEEENSIRDFSIDWTPPAINALVLPAVSRNATQEILTEVSDNIDVANCDLYIDGQGQGEQLKFTETSCASPAVGKCYLVSGQQVFSPGRHKASVGCWDIAGNVGYSSSSLMKITPNHSPDISFCRVAPAQGNLRTDFKFTAEASDQDGDTLSYRWVFGDGGVSHETSPVHQYGQAGVYEPQVAISDGREEVKCSTAWVSVSGD